VRLGLAAVLIWTTGCHAVFSKRDGRAGRWADVGHACSEDSAARSLAPELVRSYRRGEPDDAFARLARTVPGGFGGFLYSDGKPTIYLVDTTKAAQAISGVVAGGIPATGAQVLQGRWDFAQLSDWMEYVTPRLTVRISFSDINEATNRLEFGGPDERVLKQLDSAFSRMHLPCHLVWIKQFGYAQFL
jgi:hypothetical protein